MVVRWFYQIIDFLLCLCYNDDVMSANSSSPTPDRGTANSNNTSSGFHNIGIGFKTLAGAAAAGLVLSPIVNAINQNTQDVAYGPREIAGERVKDIDSGTFTLKPGAIIRANPVVANGGEFNGVCLIGEEPVSIAAETVTIADGVKTNPNDPNGPWVMIDLNGLPVETQAACHDGIELDQDGKGWVSVAGGAIDPPK